MNHFLASLRCHSHIDTCLLFSQMANGLCDNLLTCVVRAWDYKKPLLFAPAMNTFMWDSPFTNQHVATLEGLGAKMIPPMTKKLACGDVGSGAMAEVGTIGSAARQEFSRSRVGLGQEMRPSPYGMTL